MKKIGLFAFFLVFNFMVVNASSKVKVSLVKCVDGDTAKFLINNEEKTVRFLSINTPELAHYGKSAEAFGEEASKYTCDALQRAKVIKLEYDPASDKTDKYDRVLAWVFVDDKLLQRELVREGLAEVKYVYADYLYTSDLKVLEAKAKEDSKGIWSNTSIEDNSKEELIMYIVAMIAVVIVALFGKSFSSKKRAIKKIRKLANID